MFPESGEASVFLECLYWLAAVSFMAAILAMVPLIALTILAGAASQSWKGSLLSPKSSPSPIFEQFDDSSCFACSSMVVSNGLAESLLRIVGLSGFV